MGPRVEKGTGDGEGQDRVKKYPDKGNGLIRGTYEGALSSVSS